MATEIISILTGAASGTLFGFALEKGKVHLPFIIREQMTFSNNLMLKMFMTGTCVSVALISAAELFSFKDRKPKPPTKLGLGIFRGYGSNVVGGFLLGIGMFLAGSCPGTVYSQLGAGVPGAIYTWLGSLVATVVYAYTYKHLEPCGHGKKSEPVTLDKNVFGTSLAFTAALTMALYGAVAYGAEKFLTSTSFELDMVSSRSGTAIPLPPMFGWDLNAPAWSPYSAGVVVGLVQIPAMLLAGDYLGTSASYVLCTGTICKLFDTNVKHSAPYFEGYTGFGSYWQLGLAAGVVAGSYFSSQMSHFPMPDSNISNVESFIGGLLLLFGARIAGGCTSGHGISGLAQQSVSSLITTCMMFGGAITTGLIYQVLGR